MNALLLSALLALPARAEKWQTDDPACIAVQGGLCNPSWEIRKSLDTRFKEMMQEYRAFRKNQQEEARLRQAAFDNPQSMLTLENWRKVQSGLRDEQTALNIKAGTLLKDISAAYRLPVDFHKDEVMTGGAFRGTTTRFDPKFAFEDFYVSRRKTADGRELTWARDYSKSQASASTIPTGEVVFRMRAFETASELDSGAVGYLASVVYHESVHFKESVSDATTKTERSELNAYQAVVERQTYIFGLPRHIREFNQSKVEEFAEKVKKDQRAKFRYSIGGLIPRWPGTGPDLLTTFHPDDKRWDELAERAKDLEAPLDNINAARTALRKRIRDEKNIRGDYEGRVRREYEALYGKPQAPAPAPADDDSSGGSAPNPCAGHTGSIPCVSVPTVQPRYPAVPAPRLPAPPVVPVLPAAPVVAAPPIDRRQRAELALVDIANRACSGSGALSQEDFDTLWGRVHKAPVTADSRDRYGLRGCAWTIYGDLAGYSQRDDLGRISVDWLNKRVGEVQAPVTTTDEVPDSPRPPDRPRCRWAGDWCK